MTEALDAMVKAMREEIVRQFTDQDHGGYFVGKDGCDSVDGTIDLEKVARAGLKDIAFREALANARPTGWATSERAWASP